MTAYIFDAVRTPRGKGKAETGALACVAPTALAAGTLAALVERNALGRGVVDDVILGCVDPIGDQAGDIARSAALLADLGEGVPGVQINRFCASGLEAVALAASRIRAGDADLIMAGGVEMMSRVGMGGSGAPFLTDPVLASPHFMVPQGISADLIATRFGYSRSDVDGYAVESQRRAARAWHEGRFARSIAPVHDENCLVVLDRDEAIRPDADMQSLGALQPSFAKPGQLAGFDAVAIQRYPDVETIAHVHHAGNSSQLADGAAAILIGSGDIGTKLGLKPRARILSSVSIGCEPTIMLTGPVEASRRALAKAGMDARSVDLWEINEAFASVGLYFLDQMGLDQTAVNANGGAIAMGHPLGATGAMILGTLVDELERADKQVGVATLCAASGQAIAMVVERV
jgi:acetyl-CoA C-acetyltransferase